MCVCVCVSVIANVCVRDYDGGWMRRKQKSKRKKIRQKKKKKVSKERREVEMNDQFLLFDLLTIPIEEFKGWSELLCMETLNRML